MSLNFKDKFSYYPTNLERLTQFVDEALVSNKTDILKESAVKHQLFHLQE